MDSITVLLLAGQTLRAQAYTQILTTIPNIKLTGLFYGFSENIPHNPPPLNLSTERYLKQNKVFTPDFSEGIVETFEKHNLNYKFVPEKNVNSAEIISTINRFTPDVVIFAGYGGQILSKEHFVTETKYLHMHPGNLPTEKGSTTIYYSILMDKSITVSSFYMNERIDSGSILLKKQYDIPPEGADIDNWIDNCIRAETLKQTIVNIIDKNDCVPNIKNASGSQYYVIHPLLKHIALLSLPKLDKYV